MQNQTILPFYMTYPELPFYHPNSNVINDLEYLQQLYPAEIKKYQKTVSNVINRMDYSGSMIYDQYPDRWTLHKTVDSILEIIKREEQIAQENTQQLEMLRYLIYMLLFDEIYKRRHK